MRSKIDQLGEWNLTNMQTKQKKKLTASRNDEDIKLNRVENFLHDHSRYLSHFRMHHYQVSSLQTSHFSMRLLTVHTMTMGMECFDFLQKKTHLSIFLVILMTYMSPFFPSFFLSFFAFLSTLLCDFSVYDNLSNYQHNMVLLSTKFRTKCFFILV